MATDTGHSTDSVLKSEEEFLDNYNLHDVVESYLNYRLRWYGFDVRDYGVDERHADTVINSVRPDIKVVDDGEVVGYVDAKAKDIEYESWFGKMNERAFEGYLYGHDGESDDYDDEEQFAGAIDGDVPVWIGMYVVDGESIVRETYIPVRGYEQIKHTFTARHDGNRVVVFEESEYRDWSALVSSYRV